MFDNNFGKCRPIFKFFHQMIRKKILYVRHKSFHLSCNMLLYYLVKFENPKNVTDFDSRDRPKPILLVSAVAETVAETEDTHSAVAEPGAESLVLVSAETVAETET